MLSFPCTKPRPRTGSSGFHPVEILREWTGPLVTRGKNLPRGYGRLSRKNFYGRHVTYRDLITNVTVITRRSRLLFNADEHRSWYEQRQRERYRKLIS